MADDRGRYWDAEECRWVRYVAPPGDEAQVPAQAAAADDAAMATAREVDVPSG
jgi:hypothetical protein